jgi:hypothetical protein
MPIDVQSKYSFFKVKFLLLTAKVTPGKLAGPLTWLAGTLPGRGSAPLQTTAKDIDIATE